MGMTTATNNDRTIDHGSAGPAGPPLAPPPKLRRRPALVAVAAAMVCLGAALAAWAWTATTNTTEVLAAREGIARGQVIDADDLARVQIGTDPALDPMPASAFDTVVGKRASLDIAEGGFVTRSALATTVVPAEGSSVVGVAVTPAQAPSEPLQVGDRVRVVVTPPAGDAPPSGTPAASDAEVVGTRYSEETGQLVVDVQVAAGDATLLAARAATGNVAIVLDSRER